MKFNKTIPELSVSNIEISKKFYQDLGFVIKYERKENKFCFLELGGNQLMIEEENDNWITAPMKYPYGRGINISMEVKDIELIRNKAVNNNYPLFLDIMINKYRIGNEEYQDKEFLIQDPDGYLLRFTNE